MKARCFLACCLIAAAVLSGCGKCGARQEQGTVTVSGTGTVHAAPDMVRMSVSMSKVERTTRLAQESVGKMAARVLEILKGAGIEDKDISTASLSFNPEYEWRSNRSVLVGQRADQRIEFAVRDIGNDAEKVARLIDQISEIDGIMMNQIVFSVADNTEQLARSREIAFEKALQKAQQYAGLSGLKVGRMLDLTEEGASNPSPIYGLRTAKVMNEAAVSFDAASTVLPSGQLEVTTRISATFLLEE